MELELEHRIILTATFTATAAQEAFYAALEAALPTIQGEIEVKRVDMTKDGYTIGTTSVTEQVI